MSSSGSVYTGAWINWTDGRLAGATLTLSSRNGAYLVAFLALFVRIAGGHFWNIFCYLVFQFRSSTSPSDGMYHQQQAILRNNSSESGALWQFLKVGWFWRRRASRPWCRSTFLILSAVLHMMAFGVAGIFSSKVTTIRSDVLLRGNHCGRWPDPFEDQAIQLNNGNVNRRMDWTTHRRNNFLFSARYVASCYGSQASANNCNSFGRRQITWEMSTNISCPFLPEICLNNTAVRFDTGYLNSHLDLGINSSPENRISYRRVMECAPITTNGFTSGWENASDTSRPVGQGTAIPNPGEMFVNYYYGRNRYYNSSATFIYSNYSFVYPPMDTFDFQPYRLAYAIT